MDKINYSNCPLKKRPIYVIDEDLEDENNAPIDLTVQKWNPPQIYKAASQVAVNYSTKLQRIDEEETYLSDYEMERLQRISPAIPQYESKPDLLLDTVQKLTTKMKNYTKNMNQTYSTVSKDDLYLAANYEYDRLHRISPICQFGGPLRQFAAINDNHHDHQFIAPEYCPSNDSDRNFNNNFIKHEFNDHPSAYYTNRPESPSHHHHHTSSASYTTTIEHQPPVNFEPEDLTMLPPTNHHSSILTERTLNTKPSENHIRTRKNHQLRDKTNNDLYYQCPTCSKCYATRPGLVKHQQCHLGGGTPQQLIKKDINTSDKNARFTNLPTISPTPSASASASAPTFNGNSQKIINVQRYQCKDCGKSYSTFSGLTKHQQFHCPNSDQNQVKKVFSCKNCDKVYVSLGALKMHIRTHTLPCKCPLCGKAFSRPWLLQGHIRTHTGEKPFTCQHCNRAFADRSNLRAHLQTHSDVKKYSCSSCTKTFSRMSLLTKHLQGGCSATSPQPDHPLLHQSPYDDDDVDDDDSSDYQHHHHHHHQQQQHHTNDSFYETAKQRSPVIVENSFFHENHELRHQHHNNNYSNENSNIYQNEMGASSSMQT